MHNVLPLRALWFAAVAFVLISSHALAAPKPVEVTIRDYVGIDWQRELVHERLAFAQGVYTGEATASVSVKGGDALPTQVSDVRRHADGSIQNMNVWWQTDLAPHSEKTFVITPGKASVEPTGRRAWFVQKQKVDGLHDMSASLDTNHTVTVTVPGIDIHNDWVQPITNLQEPIVALKKFPSGVALGPGRFEVPFKLRSRTTTIDATGPIFAQVTIRYTFDVGYWHVTLRTVAGSPMVQVYEEFDTGHSGKRSDDADRFYVIPLQGKGFAPTQAFFTDRVAKPEFCDLFKRQAPAGTSHEDVGALSRNLMCVVSGYTLSADKAGDQFYVNPFSTWSNRASTMYRAVQPGGNAVGIAPVDSTRWRNQHAIRIHMTQDGKLEARLPIQKHTQHWPIEGFGDGSPNYTNVTLDVPPTTSRRHWGIMLTDAEDESKALLGSMFAEHARHGAHTLDEVRRWTLDWPDPMKDAKWAAETTDAGKTAIKQMEGYRDFMHRFGHVGVLAMWKYRSFTHGRYGPVNKVLNDPTQLSWEDRRKLRRLLAFQGHELNSVGGFAWGVGVHLGNPNMSLMAMRARVRSAMMIPDHPDFEAWGRWNSAFMRDYVYRFTRESGAPYENTHYTLGVTMEDMLDCNQLLLEAGLPDALDSERFDASLRFLPHWLAPPDARFGGHRLNLPFGNGASYNSVKPKLAQDLVAYLKARGKTGDMELAGLMQWYSNQTLPEDKHVNLVKDVVPDLKSWHAEEYGMFFRHGFGTENETLFHLFAGNCDGHYEWEQDQMSYTLYAKGHPISLHFANGYHPSWFRPWVRNRVTHNMSFERSERNETKIHVATIGPETEYCRARRSVDMIRKLQDEYPILTKNGMQWAPEEGQRNWANPDWKLIPMTHWDRQIMFLKDADPKGQNYFVIRESFDGSPTQPTELSQWFLATEMKKVDNYFHFVGQAGVDADVFINYPAGIRASHGQVRPSKPTVRPLGQRRPVGLSRRQAAGRSTAPARETARGQRLHVCRLSPAERGRCAGHVQTARREHCRSDHAAVDRRHPDGPGERVPQGRRLVGVRQGDDRAPLQERQDRAEQQRRPLRRND